MVHWAIFLIILNVEWRERGRKKQLSRAAVIPQTGKEHNRNNIFVFILKAIFKNEVEARKAEDIMNWSANLRILNR